MKNFQCTRVRAARQLVKFIKVDIPEGYDPGDHSHKHILARIREQCTNYDGLSSNLPACPCPGNEANEFECPNSATANDTLEWAANGLVELAYREWLAKQRA
jgi:hypothetical protein